MSVRFEADDGGLRIVQRRFGLRIAMWIVAIGSIAGLVIVPLIGRLPHTGRIVCDRERGACTVTYQPEDDTRDIPLASIREARVAEERGSIAVILDRDDPKLKHQWVCQAPSDGEDAAAIRAAGAGIKSFFANGTSRTLDVTCPNHGGELNPWLLVPVVIAGNLIILLGMGIWLQEAHTTIDRHRIVMRGRSGFRKKWSLDRPKGDVVGVSLEKRYVMRGNYRHLVYVHFNDGAKVLAMAPAFYRLPTLEKRTNELRKRLGV